MPTVTIYLLYPLVKTFLKTLAILVCSLCFAHLLSFHTHTVCFLKCTVCLLCYLACPRSAHLRLLCFRLAWSFTLLRLRSCAFRAARASSRSLGLASFATHRNALLQLSLRSLILLFTNLTSYCLSSLPSVFPACYEKLFVSSPARQPDNCTWFDESFLPLST